MKKWQIEVLHPKPDCWKNLYATPPKCSEKDLRNNPLTKFSKLIFLKDLNRKQKRNSNQVRALLGQSIIGTDRPTDGRMNKVSYTQTFLVGYIACCTTHRGAMLAPKTKKLNILTVFEIFHITPGFETNQNGDVIRSIQIFQYLKNCQYDF